MNTSDVLKIVDHTLLTQTATWAEIKEILDDAMKFGTASACIPAAYVKQAAEYVDGKLPICTVIGFPNGYSTTATKVFETKGRHCKRSQRDRYGHQHRFLKGRQI